MVSGADVIDAAVRHAHAAFLQHRDATVAKRVEWLLAAADAIDKIESELVRSLIRFIGKPRRAATFEAKRVGTFMRACAAQVPHLMGEVLPLDTTAAGAGRFGFTTRVPYGVVAAVTPFNGPANLLIQKVAPAIAMGNAVVVKPSAAARHRSGAPARRGGEEGRHPRWVVQRCAGQPRDSQAPVRASPDRRRPRPSPAAPLPAMSWRAPRGRKNSWRAGLERCEYRVRRRDCGCATRIAGAAFEASGQQCISAQRVIVEQAVFDRFLDLFVAAAKKLKVGDPEDAATDLGPMVSSAAADRVAQMIDDAVSKGARLVLRPERKGAVLGPAIVANAPIEARLMREEAFGPVVVVQAVANVNAALDLANASEFGLQGACFTASLETAFKVSRKLRVGSLWINDASRFRLDTYPFGGVGASGFGREGVRYAMEELSQWKFTGMRLNVQ